MFGSSGFDLVTAVGNCHNQRDRCEPDHWVAAGLPEMQMQRMRCLRMFFEQVAASGLFGKPSLHVLEWWAGLEIIRQQCGGLA
jgi:hypothetical protein